MNGEFLKTATPTFECALMKDSNGELDVKKNRCVAEAFEKLNYGNKVLANFECPFANAGKPQNNCPLFQP